MTRLETLAIPVATRPVEASVHVPGSKSLTNRALPIAALAEGVSVLSNVLDSDDTRIMMDSLRRLGFAVHHDHDRRTARIEGLGGRIPSRRAELYLGNSGTSMRFLAAFVASGRGTYTLDGSPRMRERPIGDLLDSLHALGVVCRSQYQNGRPPLTIEAGGLDGGAATVRGDVSSQFLSALLLAAPLAHGPLTLRVEGSLVSQPYIEMTLATMRDFGVTVERNDFKEFHLAPAKYVARDYAVEPDASAASYFFGAAAITGGRVTVPSLGSASLQGDLEFVRLLERMGCQVVQTSVETTVIGGPLHGVDVDMNAVSDTVPTLAAVACFATGPTNIRNVAHIRVKECDRLSAVVAELRRLGVEVVERGDGLTIHPGPMHGATVETYDDHRIAMSLALIGLRIPGVMISDPGCTAKTYPDYFQDLAAIIR